MPLKTTSDRIRSHTPLSDLNILALDCQATGANPSRGYLLELGWTRAGSKSTTDAIISGVRSYLLRLPADAEIPRPVQRITGISGAARENVRSPESVWQLLLTAAGKGKLDRTRAVCPIVIHFARFEMPFLQELQRQFGPAGSFPFQIVCTHEIARRLLPQLPRRGIRAIAGYYGHCMPELKRSADHAIATAVIWQHMVRKLENNFGIYSLKHLVDWLAETRPAGGLKRKYPMDPELRRRLPDKPGIYRMSHRGGSILYIGKAKSLRQRVNSYFRPKTRHAEHILEMLTQARELAITRTDSALEAAVLESDEIKHYSPPYNIALRRRQREIAFCSRDLIRRAARSNRDCPVGPLPAGNPIEALAAFGRCLKDGFKPAAHGGADLGSTLLALPAEFAPESECLQAGMELFQRRYHRQLGRQSPLGFLTALGARLWQAHREAKALDNENSAGQHDGNTADRQEEAALLERSWSPEDVVAAIESTIRQGAYLIRRARWFCLLSESALVWPATPNSDAGNNRIVLANGSIIERGLTSKSAAKLTPTGHAKSFRRRQNSIDLMAYDRLRVVTTEIRRIIAEGRRIELCLRPYVTMGPEALSRLLRWV